MAEEIDKNTDKQEKNIVITDSLVSEFLNEILTIEQDNLYVNRANIKERIVVLAKTRVR